MPSMKFLDPDHMIKGSARSSLERVDRAIWAADFAAARKALTPLRRMSDPAIKAFANLSLGDVYHFEWRQKAATRAYEAAQRNFEKADLIRGEIFTTYRIVDTGFDDELDQGERAKRTWSARFKRSLRQFDASRRRANRIGDDFLVAFGHHYRGLFHVAIGRNRDAVRELDRAIRIRTRIKDVNHLQSSRALKAAALVGLGKPDEALDLATDAFRIQSELRLRGPAQRTLLTVKLAEDALFRDTQTELLAGFTSQPTGASTPFTRTAARFNDSFQPPQLRPVQRALILHS